MPGVCRIGDADVAHCTPTKRAQGAVGIIDTEPREYQGKSAATLVGFGSGLIVSITKTGTSYTLVLADAFKTVTSSNGSAQTITIPLNSSVAFAVGDRVDIIMLGSGTTSVTGASGVTVNGVNGGTGAIAAQYAAVSCVKLATNTWVLMGNHGGVS